MTHKELEELVGAYIDFEVTLEEEGTVCEHLEVCPSCRSLCEQYQYKVIKEKLRGLNEMILVPPDLHVRVTRSLGNVKYDFF